MSTHHVPIRKVIASTLTLLLALTTSGCFTPKLWKESPLREFAEPSQDGRMELRLGPLPKRDYLLAYDEVRERSERVRRKAYWLLANQERTSQERKPHFVKPRAARGLTIIPVFDTPPTATNAPPIYALAATDGRQVTVVEHGMAMGVFELPVYQTTRGKVERVLLTPLAVVGDTVIVVAATAGFVVLIWWSAGGGTIPGTDD